MTQDVNRVIADGLRAARLPEGLAWEPAKQCPQGHPNDDMAVNQGIGEMCRTCEARWVLLEPDGTAGRADEVRARDHELFEHRRDVNWHPEFRIQAVPHDFTDADYLVPAAEAFCNATQQGYLHFESYRGWNAESTRVWFSRLNRGEEVEDATRGEAEAKAFGSLITRERARLPL